MKARLILITILFFAALHMSSCFLKPKRHINDHRGVYKDKGVTKDQLVYLEERKQRMHPKKYHRKSVKQHKREDRAIDKELAKSSKSTTVDTSNHNITAQPIPAIPASAQDTSKHMSLEPQQAPAISPTVGPDLTIPTADQPVQPDPAAKKEKKKHKKSKPKSTE